jgi:DMAP1-binding Domain
MKMPPSGTPSQRGLPSEVQSKLAQIEHEYQQGELTQRGYELRRSRILSPIDMSTLNLHTDGTGRLNTSGVLIDLPQRNVVY